MGKKESSFDNPPNEDAKVLKQKRQRLKKEKRALKRQQKRKEKAAVQDETITSSTEDTASGSYTSPHLTIPAANSTNSKKMEEKQTDYDVLWQSYIPMNSILIRQPDWYMERPTEKESPKVIVNLAVRKKLKDFAAEIYRNELVQLEKFEENSGDRDVRFRRQIFAHGAMKDRITAHVLQLAESPVQSLSHLGKLCDIVACHKEGHLKEISKSLEDVLSSSLLPKGLVARQFEEHDFHQILLPLVHTDRQKAYTILLLWYYEDQLRLQYIKLVNALKQVVSTGTSTTKKTAVQLLLSLLGNHPQQETEDVLQILVNKLGDLEKVVAYAAVHGIRNLLIRRPALKHPTMDVCGEFLFRPNQRKNTLYNCMQLLKDILFTKDDVSLVQKMIKLYFGFFKACTKTGEVDGKLMSVILRGLNRALPYATSAKGRAGSSFLEEQFGMLYKMVHLAKFNISVQILQLVYQVLVNVEPDGALPARFERVLYERLFCPELSRCSVVGAFLNLVFKTMSRMTCTYTLKAFSKRLLQICFYQASHLAIAIVFVLSEASKDNKLLCGIIDELCKVESSKLVDSDKPSNSHKMTSLWGAEPLQVVDPLARGDSKNALTADDDDGEEYFEDLDVAADGKIVLANNNKSKISKSKESNILDCSKLISNVEFGEKDRCARPTAAKKQLASWLHHDKKPVESTQEEKSSSYDAYHRNPKYCGSQYTKVWELRNAMNHFHPSLTAFTKGLVEQECSKYTGDPLIDYSLIKFLDRFVNKAPKKIAKEKLGGGAAALGAKSGYSGQKKRTMCVASDYFRNMDEDRVPEDAKFFHKYFTSYSSASSRPAKPDEDRDRDCDDVDDAEFERYLVSAAGKKGVTQNPFKHDDELDDQWDFAANAKGIRKGDEDSDAYSDDLDEEEDAGGDDDDGGENNDGALDRVDYGDMSEDEDLQDDDEANFDDGLDDFDDAEDHGHLYLEDEEMDAKPVQNRKKIEQKLKVVAEKNKKSKRELKKENLITKDIKTKGEKAFDEMGSSSKFKNSKGKGTKDSGRKRKRSDEELLDYEADDDDEWMSLGDGDSDDDFRGKSRKMKKLDDVVFGKKKDRSARSLDAMMMDADEFSEMLQRNENRPPAITSSDFVNTANISQKQLRWERAHASDSLKSSKKKHKPGKFSGRKGGGFGGTKARSSANAVHRKGTKLKPKFNKR